MKELYNKVDQYLLTKYPRLWVLGVHIFIPILLVAWLILIVIGAIMVQGHESELYKVDDTFEEIGIGMILPVLLLVILFVIRQAKYNAVRVHQHLPFKKRFGVFLSFWGILFLITGLPMAVNFGSWFTPGLIHNRSAYKSDIEIIEKNYAHFRVKGCDGAVSIESGDELFESYEQMEAYPCVYKLDKTGDSLSFKRYYTNSYYVDTEQVTISIDRALKEIETFIKVSKKYGATYTEENPRKILDINLAYSGEGLGSPSQRTYDHIQNFELFEINLNTNRAYESHYNVFAMFDGEFWRYYSLLAFTLAYLLIIFCSVERAEFGWSMLVCALMPTAYGIILGLLALIGMLDGEFGARFLLMVFVVGSALIAFGNFKPKLKRIFGISLNIFLPIVLPIIFLGDDFDEDSYVIICFVLGLILTFVASFYYRILYLHPRKT